MSADRDNKQAKAKKGTGKAATPKAAKPPKSQAKKENTRFGTILDTRSGDKKKGGGARTRDRLRDGS